MKTATVRTPVTRERIVETAKKLLRQYGASKMTLSDVARDMGVSHAALYRYFRGKPALDTAIVEEWMADSMARIERAVAEVSDPVKRCERLLVEMHADKKDKIRADPEVYQLYLSVMQSNSAAFSHYTDVIRKAVADAFVDHFGRKDKRLKEAMEVMENAIFRFLHPVHTLESLDEDTNKQLRHVVRAVFRAFPPAHD